MKKLVLVLLFLILLVACSNEEKFDEGELEILKCEYISESLVYDNISRIKLNEIITSTVTVYSETDSSKEEVVDTLEAFFDTEFSYAEQDDLKILSAIISPSDMSDAMKSHLLLDGILDEPEHSIQAIIDSIENHNNKEVSVTCKLI